MYYKLVNKEIKLSAIGTGNAGLLTSDESGKQIVEIKGVLRRRIKTHTYRSL
jgi:hypothetical protein